MTVDVCTYLNERDLWDIHYNVLKPYVDQFIVVEATRTFSGKPHILEFPHETYPDVKYFVVDDWNDENLWEMAQLSPNTQGADHWKTEFYIKESIKKALTHLKDNDIVFIGDVDEIWNPFFFDRMDADQLPLKLKMKVYTYWLNNRSSEEFWGPLVSSYQYVKKQCLNHLRTNAVKSSLEMGWHFTSMGGTEKVKEKLTDSYTHETYASPIILGNLGYNIARNKDFLGRDFTYSLDEADWPSFLKETRDNYKHLIKNHD